MMFLNNDLLIIIMNIPFFMTFLADDLICVKKLLNFILYFLIIS